MSFVECCVVGVGDCDEHCSPAWECARIFVLALALGEIYGRDLPRLSSCCWNSTQATWTARHKIDHVAFGPTTACKAVMRADGDGSSPAQSHLPHQGWFEICDEPHPAAVG